MIVVDANVLVYAANTAAPEHATCRARLETWRQGAEPWGTTWSVVYEFLRVVTHPRVFSQPLSLLQAWAFFESLAASPSFRVLLPTERHAELAARTIGAVPLLAGNVLHDLHTAVVMREHGARRITTRDTDFHRFPFLEVLDPLAPPVA